MKQQDALLIGAVGDVFINRKQKDNPFRAVQEIFSRFDYRFGNCEGVYGNSLERSATSRIAVVSPAQNASTLGPAGFHVMSLANNHTMDAGAAGLASTQDILNRLGIAAVGAGTDAKTAFAPVLHEVAGRTIATLAVTSIFRPGYPAGADRPGVAALRAHAHYYFPEWHPTGIMEPGTPPNIHTFCDPQEMDRLLAQLRELRRKADIVLVSCHWGVTGPADIQSYERELGKALIDNGADVIFGHHQHFIRGVELHRGKPIFYGLGHFIFDLPGLETAFSPEILQWRMQNPYGIYPRSGFPLLPFHPEARIALLAAVSCKSDGLVEAAILPCLIDSSNAPFPVGPEHPQCEEVVGYLRSITAKAGLPTCYRFDSGELSGAQPMLRILPAG